MTIGKLAMAVATAFALSAVAVPALAQHDHGSHGGGGGGGGWHGGGGHGGFRGGGGHDGGWHGGGFHGGHHRFFGPSIGLSFGFPFYSYWGPGYYPYAYDPYPYSYYSGEVYDDGAPQVYIQRDNGDTVAPTSPARPDDYSYYCTNPAGYFPQVPNCPGGWLKVVPNGSPRPAPR